MKDLLGFGIDCERLTILASCLGNEKYEVSSSYYLSCNAVNKSMTLQDCMNTMNSFTFINMNES